MATLEALVDIVGLTEPSALLRVSSGHLARCYAIPTPIAPSLAHCRSRNRRAEVEEQDLQDAMRVGIDGLQEYRRRILLAVIQGRDPGTLRIPRTVRDRELENLRELRLLEQVGAAHKPTSLTDRLWTVADVKLP